jgi:hypothetical protein
MTMRNQYGFSLVQGLLVAGISAGLLLVLNSQQQLFKKTERTSELNREINEVVGYIEKILTNPYNCSATVGGIVPATMSQLNTNIGLIPAIRSGRPRETYNPEIPSTGPFYLAESAIISPGDELRGGLLLQNLRLITTPSADFIRMEIRPQERYRKEHLGGQNILKDFLISTKRSTSNPQQIGECNRNFESAHIRQTCLAMRGSWDPVASACNMDDLIDRRTLTKIWVQEGKVRLFPIISDEYNYGRVACDCDRDRRRCSRVSMPCTCSLPACASKFSQCADGTCIYADYHNYDRNQSGLWDKSCMWAAYCKKLPPTNAFLIPPPPSP